MKIRKEPKKEWKEEGNKKSKERKFFLKKALEKEGRREERNL